jgi:hypothetical protein
MRLFLHKLDPCTKLTLELGPQYAERLFEVLLIKDGVDHLHTMSNLQRWERCIELLKKKTARGNRKELPFVQFYMAHFYQQLSGCPMERECAARYREDALHYYRSYLIAAEGTVETRYYAQWQTGILQDQLGYHWHHIRESLLKANAIDPIRGESIKSLVLHYMSAGEWPAAYTYSQFARNNFFNRNPIAVRRWYVDFDSYNGNLLERHIAICNQLGYRAEANQTHRQLLDYVIEHIHEFEKVEKHLVKVVNRFYHQPETRQISQSL